MKEIVLTGLRANNEYQLGNYIGALLPVVRLIKEHKGMGKYQINLFVPDLHSFTTPIDFSGFYTQTMKNLRLCVAAGVPLDDEDVNLYRQSRITAHSELAWILSNFAGFGDLSRMVEFKEKSAVLAQKEQVSAGLFTYPILMAADILLYDAKWVPVGDDQRQHLEFCRRLARSFNQLFESAVFILPASFEEQQAWLERPEAPRIRSLRHPEKKMSKSIVDPIGTIMLSDDCEEAAKKVMSATTDNLARINYDWQKQPGITNLLAILAGLSEQTQTEINRHWCGSSDYKALKTVTAEVVRSTLERLQNRLKSVSADDLEAHLRQRENKLANIANSKLIEVQKTVGLRESL